MTAMTDRMSSLDAYFIFTEADGVNHMHVGGVALVDGAAPQPEQLVEMLRGKMDRIPRYRQVVQPVPLHLGRPVWVDPSQFDVAEHVRGVTLPEHGHAALRT